jgi:hypothetical protein
MKCAKAKCDNEAVSGSNYCDSHQPTPDKYEHRQADIDIEKSEREKR